MSACESEMDGGIYERWEEVPTNYLSQLTRDDDGGSTYDFLGVLQGGKDWLIEPLQSLQPRSFQAFQEVVGPLKIGFLLIVPMTSKDDSPRATPVLFFDAAGRMVQVFPNFPGRSYEDGNDTSGAMLSLPDSISRSWLWRAGGWRVPGEPYEGLFVRRLLIGHPSTQWKPVEDVLRTFDPKRWKWMMKGILERFPDAVVTHHHPEDGSPSKWTSMRCFLDTRPPGINGPVGDQFFVFDEKRDQVVYHIHNGDLDDVRILMDPADAIDHYCAHVLRRTPEVFDFSPWSERHLP